MLGNVEISYQGKPFTIERNNTTKVNQLFQMLLYFPNGLTRDQIMYNLFHNEEIADPSNSLRALVFRLRRALPKVGLPEEDYVYVKRGVYKINPSIVVDCDAIEFEEAAKKALACEDAKERDEARKIFEPMLKKEMARKLRAEIKRKVKELNDGDGIRTFNNYGTYTEVQSGGVNINE